MRYLSLIRRFVEASAQQEMAYRSNFFINILHSVLQLVVGVAGVVVIFNQVESIRGWTFASVLAVLGVYLLLGALRGLFIGPSLDALSGMDGEVWRGVLDFTLLRPIDTQFLASFRYWRLFSLVDLLLALSVLGLAISRLGQTLSAAHILAFLLALTAALLVLYAILLSMTALVFWSPGFLFTWMFDGVFQMARYPVGLYPGWLRLALTWVIPAGVMTTIPAQALAGEASPGLLLGSLSLALVLILGASALFRVGLRCYHSASS